MTPDEVKDLCEKILPMGQKEAQEFLSGYGLNPKNADVLRHLLGTTKKRPDNYTKEYIEECRRMVEEEGMSVKEVAKLKGIFATTIYNWVYKYDWNIVKGHYFWTEIKIRTLVNEIRKGTERKTIAMKLGCTKSMVNNMWQRCSKRSHVHKWEGLLDKIGLKREAMNVQGND